MKANTKNSKRASVIFAALIIIPPVILFLFTNTIPQWPEYHHFADTRTIWRIPNFFNVVSNAGFILVSVLGFFSLGKQWRSHHLSLREAVVFATLFLGVFLIGIGSSYYHWAPDNDRLVWDRIPMTLVFMSLLSLTLMERVSQRLGFWLLIPFVAFGIGSVLYWHHTELAGQGDIRWYGLAQFYSIFLIMLTLIFFRRSYPSVQIYLWMFGFYVLAKMTEHFDWAIYQATGFISGHTLKHIFAAISVYFLVIILNKKPSCNQS